MSKRLMAKGVRNHPLVKTAYNTGNIGITRGTTCTYIAEEFLERRVEPFSYTTGLTLPKEPSEPVAPPETKMHDIIIRNGDLHIDGETVGEASKNFGPGDIIIKGANALNYEKKIAGCLIGHPAGGTVGGIWGPLYGKKIHLIIPVGLEKIISGDILEISAKTMQENPGNALMPMTGIIITEIEAINILTGATAYQVGAGGIRGAEGAVRLQAYGSSSEVNSLKQIISEIETEKSF